MKWNYPSVIDWDTLAGEYIPSQTVCHKGQNYTPLCTDLQSINNPLIHDLIPSQTVIRQSDSSQHMLYKEFPGPAGVLFEIGGKACRGSPLPIL
jgi:hypothetical protein